MNVLQWLPALLVALLGLAGASVAWRNSRRRARGREGRQPGAVPALHPDDGAMSAVISALRAGQKIEAIKAYRVATGAGLKEAKDAVEALEHRLLP